MISKTSHSLKRSSEATTRCRSYATGMRSARSITNAIPFGVISIGHATTKTVNSALHSAIAFSMLIPISLSEIYVPIEHLCMTSTPTF